MLTPARRMGFEILDEPGVSADDRARAMRDIARSNAWFGGRRALLRAWRRFLQRSPDATLSLIDVGTGTADLPLALRRVTASRGQAIMTIGVDASRGLLLAARDRVDHVVCASATALPFRDRAVDVVTCSQLLHHFEFSDGERVVGELTRVAGRHVIVADLRRSWIAAAGFWLASFPLRFHPITRHDGVVSVLRGFTTHELSSLVRRATGVRARVARGLGYRLVAQWTP